MNTKIRLIVLLIVLGVSLLLVTGCNKRLTAGMETFNASATQITSGGGVVGTPLAMLTPAPTDPPNTFDLSVDASQTLVHAWGQVYGLNSGAEFAIIASQQQVGDFIIQTLQIGGWQDTVKGGSVTIGTGQIRLDVALVDTAGNFGSGTVTFQPTLDELGRLHLNPLGAQFGSLQIPNGLTAALGDSVRAALTGSQVDTLSKVNLKTISMEEQIMKISGTLR